MGNISAVILRRNGKTLTVNPLASADARRIIFGRAYDHTKLFRHDVS